MSQLHEKTTQRSRGDLLRVWAIPLAIVALGFIIAMAGVEPPPPDTIRLASGSNGGAYHDFAERYREVLAERGFDLQLVETAGSMENLELLRSGEVDIAFVQGGTPDLPADREKLQALASIFFEPLWVFQRQDTAVDQLRLLNGRRLIIGGQGSGTNALVKQLLAANDIDSTRAELIEVGGKAAADRLLAGDADAAFFVTSGRAGYLRPLLESQDFSLMSIERERAYANRFRFLSPLVLGRGAIDLAADLPRQDQTLVASAALLVAGNEMHHALVPLLLDTAKQVHNTHRTFSEEADLPSARFSELPLSKEAIHYLEQGPSFLHRNLGFWAASTVDRLKILLLPLITLLIPVFKAAPPIYRWRIRSKIYRWYEDLKLVDDVLGQGATPDELAEHIRHLETLEEELTDVQVPLSYMDEFYRLRVHIELILAKLKGQMRQGESLAEVPPDADDETQLIATDS